MRRKFNFDEYFELSKRQKQINAAKLHSRRMDLHRLLQRRQIVKILRLFHIIQGLNNDPRNNHI